MDAGAGRVVDCVVVAVVAAGDGAAGDLLRLGVGLLVFGLGFLGVSWVSWVSWVGDGDGDGEGEGGCSWGYL